MIEETQAQHMMAPFFVIEGDLVVYRKLTGLMFALKPKESYGRQKNSAMKVSSKLLILVVLADEESIYTPTGIEL